MNIHLQINKERIQPRDIRQAFEWVHQILHIRFLDRTIEQVLDTSYTGVTFPKRPKRSAKNKR